MARIRPRSSAAAQAQAVTSLRAGNALPGGNKARRKKLRGRLVSVSPFVLRLPSKSVPVLDARRCDPRQESILHQGFRKSYSRIGWLLFFFGLPPVQAPVLVGKKIRLKADKQR